MQNLTELPTNPTVTLQNFTSVLSCPVFGGLRQKHEQTPLSSFLTKLLLEVSRTKQEGGEQDQTDRATITADGVNLFCFVF